MQLLDSEQLEFALQAYHITLESEARTFYTEIWNIIQAGEKIRDPLELSDLGQSLRRLCGDYFQRTKIWRNDEQDKIEGQPVCAASTVNSTEAHNLLAGFEKQFTRYVLCYLELNRALIQKRAQLSHFAKDYNIDDLSKSIEVSHSTGILLERAHKERQVLLEKHLRMERLRTLLQHFDGPLEFLGAFLPDIYGQVEGDHQLTLFKGALRKQNFGDARKICSTWQDARMREPAMTLIEMAHRHADELKVQESLLLHSGELSLILAFLKDDEVRMDVFMQKYNVPYMVFQYRHLIRQGYLLGHVGSIEGLIIQHAKLCGLAARLHDDPILAQSQETAVLVPTRLMMAQNFKNLGAIFSEMENICAILEKLFTQTRDFTRRMPQH